MSEKGDVQLVREALSGSKEAFEALVARYHNSVYSLASRWTRSLSEAEDITQDAFLPARGEAAFQAYEHLESLRQPEKFQAWLRAIVRNRCRRWSKQQSRLVFFDPFDEEERDQIPHLQQSRTPADEFEHKARYEAIIEAIRRLPEKFSVVLMLYYLDGLSYREIGRYLDVPTSTVKGRVQLGRQRLREEIEPIMQEMLFEIPEKVKVSGTVHFEGQPIEGATIYAYSGAADWERIEAETQTYKDGAFVFDALTNVPDRLLIASKPGWAFGWTYVKGTENREDVAIELHEAESVCGTVLNTEEKPIQGACIQAYYVKLSEASVGMCESKVARATTDFEGHFCLSDIPKGAGLAIQITHPDYSLMNYIKLVAGAKDLTFKLAKGGTIEGHLLYGTTGEPAAGIMLAAIRSDFAMGLTLAKTDEDGFFCLENLTPGLYSVYLESKLDAWTMVAAKEVLVSEGQTVSGIELKLIKGGWITGRLTDADTGEPFADKWLAFHDSSRQGVPSGAGAKTDENGVYRFRAAPGEATIHLSPSPGYVGPEQIHRSVNVVEGETVNADFSLHRKKTEQKRFVIALVTPDGKPVAGAQIYRKPGKVSLADDEGLFTLEWQHPHQEESFLFANWCTPSRKRTLFIIQPKLRLCGVAKVQFQTEGECQIKLEPYQVGEVKGRLVDEKGEPVVGALIRSNFRFHDGPRCQINAPEAMSDKHGEFRLSNLIVGCSYGLSISKKGYGNAGSSFVPTVETLMLPEIVLQTADQYIAGRVTTPDGVPLPGVRVYINTDPPGWRETFTGAEGQYRLTELTKRRVCVKVETGHIYVSREVLPGEDTARNEVERRSGFSDFVMDKTGDRFVSGKILDVTGQPVSNAWIYVKKGETLYHTHSDENGRYHLPHLSDEMVELVVTHTDYSTVYRSTETNKSDVDFVLTPV